MTLYHGGAIEYPPFGAGWECCVEESLTVTTAVKTYCPMFPPRARNAHQPCDIQSHREVARAASVNAPLYWRAEAYQLPSEEASQFCSL